jgi:hypothetical protein
VEEVILSRQLRTLALASCVGLLPPLARACSFTQAMIKGASSFKVRVVDYRERPVEGAAIVLTRGDKEMARFKTDSRGEVTIGQLPPARYEMALAHDVPKVFEDSYGIEVTKTSKGQGDIVFHWPPNAIATHTLSGVLHYWKTAPAGNGLEKILKHDRGEGVTLPLAKAQLSLFTFLSAQKVAETTTDDAGRFDFRVAEPGLYYMRFKFETYEETVVVDLDRDFAGSAPFLDVLIDDVIICGDAPQSRSLNSPT